MEKYIMVATDEQIERGRPVEKIYICTDETMMKGWLIL